MERLPQTNFVYSDGLWNYEPSYSEKDLETILLTTLRYFDTEAENFNINACNSNELKNLFKLFLHHTLDNETKVISLQETLTFVKKSVGDILLISAFLNYFSDNLEKHFYQNEHRNPNNQKIESFISTSSRIIPKLNKSFLSLKNIYSIIDRLKQMSAHSENLSFPLFIEIFHECDLILEMNIKIYLSLQKSYENICFIFTNYHDYIFNDYLVSENLLRQKYQAMLHDYIKNMALKCNLKIDDLIFNSKSLFFQTLISAERIIYWLINYKINIMDALINEKSKYRISNDLFNNCFNYFERFYKLSILRNQLVNNYYVETTVDRHIWQSSNKIIPLFLRSLHAAIKRKKAQIQVGLKHSGTFQRSCSLIDELMMCELCRCYFYICLFIYFLHNRS
jgi:hypothetical protein